MGQSIIEIEKSLKHPFRKYQGSIEKNYADYLAERKLFGFMDSFPETGIVFDEIEVYGKCRNFDARFKVRFSQVSFGPNNEWVCRAIVTDRVDISKFLPMSGFNSYCYENESDVMELGVIEMAKKRDLLICSKINSWPFAKAIVSENHFLS